MPLWLWPLLGALLVGPLRAGQFERVPVAAVNALIAAGLVLWALRPEPAGSGEGIGPSRRGRRREPVTLCLGAFLGLNLFSLAVSLYPHGTLTALLDVSALLGAYLLIAHDGGRRAAVWILGAILLAGFAAAALALREYSQEAWGHNNPGWRAFGPFFNPNLLAATAILLAPLSCGLMLRAERPLERLASGFTTLLFVAALLVSGSRGGALALGVGAVAFLVVAAARGLRLDPQRALAVAGLLIALLPVLWVLRVPMLGRLAHIHGTPAVTPGSPAAGASERSNAFRRLIWRATAQIVRAKPLLGTGAGTFEFALPRYSLAGYTRMAHESYLQIAAETGVLSLLAWLGALGLVLARLVSRRRGPPDWLLPGLAGGIVAAMAHNLVDYSWSVTGTALPFWVFLGLAVALTRAEDGQATPGEPRRYEGHEAGKGSSNSIESSPASPPAAPMPFVFSWFSLAGSHIPKRAALGLAGVLLLGLNGVWLQAAERQQQGQADLKSGDPRAALEQYQAAVALTPLDAGLYVELAGAQAAVGDRESAGTALRRAAALAPTWGRPHYRLGRLLESEGRLPEAAAAYEQAAARDPRSTQPLAALAAVREAQGDHPAALAVYRRILAIENSMGGVDQMTDSIPALAHEAMGHEAEKQGDREQAVREYRTGAERLRQWRRERGFRNSIQEAQGEGFAERDAEFLRADARLWGRLAGLYAHAGRMQEAGEARTEVAAARADLQKLGT